MKRVKILMMATVAAVLAAPCVQADSVVLKVKVPFEFVVGDQLLPSGEYRFVQAEAPALLRVYSKSNERLAVVPWVPLAKGTKADGDLVFQKCGGQRFLKMIRPADGSGAYLPKSRLEEQAEAGAIGMP